ncbi:MAG TPA: phosphatidylserine decarboxylase [Geminicoccaceae bacterium]|nr:phosphatidylserine decarboxylase [Geminicoccaceae bacterium]
MRLPKNLETVLVPIHRAGWPFVAAFFAVAVLLGLLWQPLFWLGLILTAWCAYFFRDPPRVTPEGGELVVSPADGVVQAVQPRTPPPEIGLGAEPRMCVSVFMNVFDVHVNRAPVTGTVTRLAYHPGKFYNASLDKASTDNERQSIRLRTDDGEEIGLVQIAGLVARRIVRGGTAEGRRVLAGERIGMIRFGSRCDVYLPDGLTPLAVVGQRAVAGETVFADGRRNLPPRTGRRS